jgi:Spherulation-specific family 4
MMKRLRLALIASTSVCAFFSTSAATAAKLEIIVPAYFYPSPNSDWAELSAAASEVPITAIMNPGNGPGSAQDSNYVSAVNSLRAAGGRVIGYIHTSYGARPLQQVLNDINRYQAWYNVDGIFIDEMANTGPAERLNYYRDIYNHVKSIEPSWEVMGNPGTTTIEQYLTWPTADRLMVFENVGANYPEYTPSVWNSDYNRSSFVHLVHTEPSQTAMPLHLQLAVQRNAGGIYITDDVLSNPWDRLPSYWTAQVNAVAAINSDYSSNGRVDAADYTVWRDTLDQSGRGLAADGNGNNQIDTGDYNIWRSHFGWNVGSGAITNGTIPEPTSEVMLAPAVAGICLWRRNALRAPKRVSESAVKRAHSMPSCIAQGFWKSR